jgi:hypothetical protein
MELEFDKEIDAILRKNARGPTTAASLTSAHLEPDEIAAFAENALPANARSFYIKHLADCDRCRTVLSQTISLIPEAEPVAASSVVDIPLVSLKEPTWFQKLFAMPGLATMMGGLVIVFVALLGYMIYQGGFGGKTEVASVRRSESVAENRTFSDQPAPSANAASNSANTAASSSSPAITSEGSPLNKTIGQSDVATDQPVTDGLDQKQPADGEKNEVSREEDRSRAASPPAAEPAAPVAAAPMMKEQPKTADADAKKLSERKVEDKRDVAKTESADTVTAAKPELSKDASIQNNSVNVQNNQQNVGGAASKSKSGPYRNMDQQRNVSPVAGARSDDEAPANRRAGGKSFEKKEGVWYDVVYHGQPTINIRRGTGEYKVLDSGLRSIAESVGGTVVVVWKDKAYRIQ